MEMADRIKERRLAMGYTQEELAQKLGLQKSAIAKYEKGRVENIKRSIILNMAAILDCTPQYLMGWVEDDSNSIIDIFRSYGYKIKTNPEIVEVTDLQKRHYHLKRKDFMDMLQRCHKDLAWNIDKLLCEQTPSISEYLMANAAHERTDIEVTEEMKRHDDDLMDDDSIWNK